MTEYLKGRQAIYEYLYMGYYKIPGAGFAELSKKFLPVFKALGTDTGGEIASGAEALAAYFEKNAHMTDKELAVRLNVNFTKLLNKRNLIGSQTENIWRQEEKSKEEIIISVSNYFADAGVVKPTEINMPIDSYGMELFYLYRTSRAAAESEGDARYKILAAQTAFAQDHILCWTDRFTRAILNQSDEKNFYRALAYLSNGFLKYDFSVSDGACDVQKDL